MRLGGTLSRCKLLTISFMVIGSVLLSSCSKGASASDEEVCNFVADNPGKLLIPTNINDLEQYRILSNEEKYAIRMEGKWFFHDQWLRNLEISEKFTNMISEDSDSQISDLVLSIEKTLEPMLLAGEIYASADNPNLVQQQQLTKLLEAESKATNLYKQIAMRCIDLM